MGFRYRLNHKRLPGHPDLVLRKYRTCIFIKSCFWHGHLVDSKTMESSVCCKIPTTNHDFWVAKIRRNKERDKEEQRKLAEMGWHCITVWECELKPKQRKLPLFLSVLSLTYPQNIFFKTFHRFPIFLYKSNLQHSPFLLTI